MKRNGGILPAGCKPAPVAREHLQEALALLERGLIVRSLVLCEKAAAELNALVGLDELGDHAEQYWADVEGVE